MDPDITSYTNDLGILPDEGCRCTGKCDSTCPCFKLNVDLNFGQSKKRKCPRKVNFKP